MGERDAAGGADEHAREDRASAEAAQREAVREALAEDDHHERADYPPSGTLDQARKLVLSREKDITRASPGRFDEDEDDDADRDADERCEQHPSAFDDPLQPLRQP